MNPRSDRAEEARGSDAGDSQARACANAPCYFELVMIVLTGFAHVTIELWRGGTADPAFQLLAPERIYNGAVAALWIGYVAWRVVRAPGIAYVWGLRSDNLMPALAASLLAALPFAAILIGYGSIMGRLPLPKTFWMIVVLYPVWGIAQQFALQVLIMKNLRTLITHPLQRAIAASGLFGAAHLPNLWLTGLTIPGGVLFTWLYERYRNLWAIGTVHGLLGALAYYLALGKDPGSHLLKLLGGQH